MTNLERLKLELSNKDYFTDVEYEVFLSENNLNSTDTYSKNNNQRDLLYTVIDILDAVSNDVDIMRKVADETTGLTVEGAYKYLEKRIDKIRDKIATIPIDDTPIDNNPFTLMFTKNR